MTDLPKIAALSTMTEVQLITAIWCGRCKTVKPEVEAICKMNGATYTVLDMADLDEEEVAPIKSLPTIRVRATGSKDPWTVYTANTLDAFKQDLAALSVSLKLPGYEDF
jgi:thiol-disulfide isomerase/thioredoxin